MTQEKTLRKLLESFYFKVTKNDDLFEIVPDEVEVLIDKYISKYIDYIGHNTKETYEGNPLENTKIISKDMLATIDIILENFPNIVFGGSVCLNALKLISRPINDIDLFIDANYKDIISQKLESITGVEKHDGGSEIPKYPNDDEIQRCGYTLNGNKICLFSIPSSKRDSLNASTFSFLGRNILIQNANEAILAKNAYSKKDNSSTKKHQEDLNNINRSLNSY